MNVLLRRYGLGGRPDSYCPAHVLPSRNDCGGAGDLLVAEASLRRRSVRVTWIRTARTDAGLLVREAGKDISFVLLFDEVEAAIATLTQVPAKSFDLRFSLTMIDRAAPLTRDQSGT